MIVVDNDVISDFWIRMDVDPASYAFGVREKDDWRVPRLGRSVARLVPSGAGTRQDRYSFSERLPFYASVHSPRFGD